MTGARRFVTLATLATLAACADGGAEGTGVSEQREAVLYGDRSGPEDDAVVQVVATSPTVVYRCTGTLVAPNLVVTALHCVSNIVDEVFTCTPAGDLGPGSVGGKIGLLLDPSAVTVRVGAGPNPAFGATAKQLFGLQTPSVCRNDIALIVLDQPLTGLPIMPIRLLKGTEPEEKVRVVGYGVDEEGGFGVRKVRSGLAISQVGQSQFRDPGDAIPPRTFVTEGPALCIGDSGGPAFVNDTVLSGVFSQIVGPCNASTARNFFTEVAPFADELVLPAFKAAGAEPWLEGNAGPAPVDAGVGAAGAAAVATGGASELEASMAGAAGLGQNASGGSALPGSPESGVCNCGVVGGRTGGVGLLLLPLLGVIGHRRLRRRVARRAEEG